MGLSNRTRRRDGRRDSFLAPRPLLGDPLPRSGAGEPILADSPTRRLADRPTGRRADSPTGRLVNRERATMNVADRLPASAGVVVVGGGIVGTASLFWLARAGLRPILIERAPALATATTAASAHAIRA